MYLIFYFILTNYYFLITTLGIYLWYSHSWEARRQREQIYKYVLKTDTKRKYTLLHRNPFYSPKLVESFASKNTTQWL